MVVVVMTVIGLVFGLILAYANKVFSIEVNPLIHIVEDILPKGQCGACGYAGCMAYAEAVVNDPNVSPSLCIPGKKPIADMVADLTGKKAAEVEPQVAQIKCASPISQSAKKYNYVGVEDCVAASLVMGGPKGCQYGCMGFGTCANNCPFDALSMNEAGLPVVDEAKCTGCGKCAQVCPKDVIAMAPIGAHVGVLCNSKDKGAAAKKVCSIPCIGCGLCAKACGYNAIKMENNLAVVDSKICIEQCNNPTCLAKCPTGAIAPLTDEVKKQATALKAAADKEKKEKEAKKEQ
jgi:RnfABCDGE-type electron transport complex B subunit